MVKNNFIYTTDEFNLINTIQGEQNNVELVEEEFKFNILKYLFETIEILQFLNLYEIVINYLLFKT